MNILVDTSVWSLALRRDPPDAGVEVAELAELIREGRVVMAGPIRQEILSGVRSEEQFERLRLKLRGFPDLSLETRDFEESARCFNRCRARGVQGSNTDFLLCALSLRRRMPILTTDQDFRLFRDLLGVALHEPRR